MTVTTAAAAGPKEAADKLFTEALTELDRGRWDAACPKFRASQAADPAVGTLLNVAACSDHEGRPLEALEQYREVLRLNASTVDTRRRASVEASALEAIKLLERRIPSLVVKVEPAGATIAIDGQPRLPGETVRLAPGAHAVRVAAEGFEPETRAINLAEAEHTSLEIDLIRSRSSQSDVDDASTALGPAGWITGGAGLAVAIGGSVLVGMAASRASEIEDVCGAGAAPPRCDGDAALANALSDEGEAFRDAGVSLLVLGGAAMATGVVLLVLAPSSSEQPVALVPVVTPEGGGLWARASF